MTAILLVGVMVDRAALTLRNLSLAALGVLIFLPEAVVHPSFQMSFAATLALISAYERGLCSTPNSSVITRVVSVWNASVAKSNMIRECSEKSVGTLGGGAVPGGNARAFSRSAL